MTLVRHPCRSPVDRSMWHTERTLVALRQCLIELGRGTQPHLHPVGHLIANVVELAPGQLDGKDVGRRAFCQGGGPDNGRTMPGDRPGDKQASALRGVSNASHQAVPQFDGEPAWRPIKARDIRLAIIGNPLSRFVGREPELHYPHGTLSARRNETASKIGEPLIGQLWPSHTGDPPGISRLLNKFDENKLDR